MSCLDGMNGCIFAYGQTGAGKTYTIQGLNNAESSNIDHRGILQRSFEFIFNEIQKTKDTPNPLTKTDFSLRCTFFEIYNEHINDLLRESEFQSKALHLREDVKKGVQIVGITQEQVQNYDEIIKLIEKGTKKRRVASTKMNE